MRKLDQLDSATSLQELRIPPGNTSLQELRIPPGNKLEGLQGSRSGQHSIRINEKYRICFIWFDQPSDVEIVDYH